MEDDHRRSQGLRRPRQPHRLQRRREMQTVRTRRRSEEREHVAVQPFGARPEHNHIGHSQHFEQQPHAQIVGVRVAQQALRVQTEDAQLRLMGGPHAHRARLLGRGCAKDLLAAEQRVVHCVRLAVAGVAEDRHHLQFGVGRAPELLDEHVGGVDGHLLVGVEQRKRLFVVEIDGAHLVAEGLVGGGGSGGRSIARCRCWVLEAGHDGRRDGGHARRGRNGGHIIGGRPQWRRRH